MPEQPSSPIAIGLYGTWGHQIQHALADHPRAKCVAIANFAEDRLPEALQADTSIQRYETLDELLADDAVQLVSLCSPNRREQAAEAIRCLEAGKHVYAEKPCAMTEAELDAILATAERTGMRFREMANGLADEQPYLAMHELVKSGELGEIVQVFAQKSYPSHANRPQDEDIDGGILMQACGHALRMVEQVACQRIVDVRAIETQLGNPEAPVGGLRMACSLNLRLESGGIATAIMNYCHPKEGFGTWGNEHLRVFGTQGMAEITDAGRDTHVYYLDRDAGPLDTSTPARHYLDMYLAELQGEAPMPRKVEDEVHVTRIAIRAKAHADQVPTDAAGA